MQRRKNVGEYLYSIRHEFGDKKDFMAEREREAAEEAANKKYVNKASLELLDRMRGRRFQQIFKYLDKDKVGGFRVWWLRPRFAGSGG